MSQPPAKTNLLAEQPAPAAKLSAFDFMSSDRPLDALLPQLKDSYIPFAPIHPRLLEMADDPTDAQWVMLWWGDLPSEPLLFRQLAKLVEATLLAELSRTPEQRRGRNPRYTGLHLLQLTETRLDTTKPLRPFAFAPHADRTTAQAWMPMVDREAKRTGVAIPSEPITHFSVQIQHPAGELGAKLEQVEAMLRDRLADEIWGNTPGVPSRLAATFIEEVFHTKIPPTLDGLRTLEMLLVSTQTGVIRWIPPMLFQALCDFIGVLGQTLFDRDIAWALCEPDGDFCTPPLLRLALASGKHIHIPIGLHLVQWCLLPLQPGEEAASLADWVADQFTGAEA
jgi:hypothetical protein